MPTTSSNSARPITNGIGTIGFGLAFPPGVGPDGRIARSSGAEAIRESIRIILSTEPGERLMLPEFGGGLHRFLFRPNTTATHRLIEETVVTALTIWESRIAVEAVEVGVDPDDARAAVVTIRFRVAETGVEDRLDLRVTLGT